MKVLLTGGSGNLGQTLVPMLLDKGHMPVILDVRAPRDLKKAAVFIEGSILDRPKLADTFCGCDCIVHIAAWHGICPNHALPLQAHCAHLAILEPPLLDSWRVSPSPDLRPPRRGM